MNAASWLGSLLPILERHALLGRLFFASVEFAALALAVGLLILIFRLRQPRLRALFWLVVLAKPLVGLAVGTPLPLLALSVQTPAPGYAGPVEFVVINQPVAAIPVGAPTVSVGVDWLSTGMQGLAILWLMGVVMFAARLLHSHWRIQGIVRSSASPASWIVDLLDRIAAEMGVGYAPRCRMSAELDSPALVGFWRPVILMPQWLCEEGDRLRVEWSLRHELMHARLRDPLAALVVELARILFFFHPTAWWAGRKWREATEMACDRALIGSLDEAESYAGQLYQILVRMRERRRLAVAGGLFAARTEISRRIEALVRDPLRIPARMGVVARGLVVIFMMASLSAGCGLKMRKSASVAPQTKPSASSPVKPLPEYPVGPLGRLGGRDLPFSMMKAGTITYNPEGNASLTGNVRIESPDFNISCDTATLNKKTRILVATGAPVKMDKSTGKSLQGECRTLMYNLEEKSFRLEGNASVVQDNRDGQKIMTMADVIQIETNEDGQPIISLMMTGNGQPSIRVLGSKANGGTKAGNKSPKRTNAITVPKPTNGQKVD